MPSDNRRPDRVAAAIREEIATFLAEGPRDPRITGFVTVTGVDVTRDLRHAKVFVSVMGSDEDRQSTLDESVARAARIESLLAQVKQEPADPDAGPTG
jgi:ribosome-binding factor A